MQFSRHLYAICGLGLILTAVSLGSNKAAMKAPPQSVLVTNTLLPVSVNGASSIQVTNKKSEGPLLVRDVDVYARVPVQQTEFGSVQEPATGSDVTMYTVPTGKRLVVQSLALRGGTPSTAQSITGATATVKTPGNNIELLMPLKVESQGTNNFGNPLFYGAMETPIYVGPENRLIVNAIRDETTGNASFFVSFAGYLEDVPPGQ